MLQVAVGSENPVKVDAVRNVFFKVHGKGKVVVFGVEVCSGVRTQPLGNQTIEGAVNRAKDAVKKTKANLGVGIEAGLFKFPYTVTGYVDMQWCAIVDRKGRLTIGCNSGFELPPSVVSRVVHEKREVGELMGEVTGIENLGEKVGAIGVLSKGYLNRLQLTEQAVLMAMIPRLNEDQYFG